MQRCPTVKFPGTAAPSEACRRDAAGTSATSVATTGSPRFNLKLMAGMANRHAGPLALPTSRRLWPRSRMCSKTNLHLPRSPKTRWSWQRSCSKQADDSRDDPTSQYVIIGEAAEPGQRRRRRRTRSAARSANWAVILRSIRLNCWPTTWRKPRRKRTPSAAFKAIAETALGQVDAALEAEQLPLAKRLSDIALSAARKAKDPATLKTAVDRNKGAGHAQATMGCGR